MMEYFWKQQDDLPEGIGYGLFSTEHMISIVVVLALVVLAAILIRRFSEDKKVRICKAIPPIMLILEIFKDLYLVWVGHFGIGYLPLHICSIGIFVFLIREYVPSVKIKGIFGEIAYILIMPASVCALLFPDWADLYPVWNFMNLYSYLWHGLLVLYPLLLKLEGKIKPTLRHIHYEIIFLLIVVPPIFLFDRAFGCNYFFVNWPIRGTPLAFIADKFGMKYYLVGYGMLTLAVLFIVYVVTGTIDKLTARHGSCNDGCIINAFTVCDKKNRKRLFKRTVMDMKYKNYIFDLYGTLIDIHTDEEQPELWEFMADYFAMNFSCEYDAKKLRKDYLKICKDEEKKLAKANGSKFPEIKIEWVWERLIGKPCSDADMRLLCNTFRERSRDRLVQYEGVAETLTAIKKFGGKVFLLSNAQRLFTEKELEDTNLTKFFDDIFISSDMGVKKPDERFLLALFEKHGLKKEESVMIGNEVLADVGVATAAGIDAIYLNTYAHTQKEIQRDLKICHADTDRVNIVDDGNIMSLLRR